MFWEPRKEEATASSLELVRGGVLWEVGLEECPVLDSLAGGTEEGSVRERGGGKSSRRTESGMKDSWCVLESADLSWPIENVSWVRRDAERCRGPPSKDL